MGQEIVDLYMTLRMIAAPFVAGAAEATAAGESMAAAVGGAASKVSAEQERMAAATTAAESEIAAVEGRLVSSNARLAASIGATSKEWQSSYEAMAATTTELSMQMTMAEQKAAAGAEAMAAKIDAAAASTTATTVGQMEKLKQIAMGVGVVAVIAAGASVKMAGDFESSTNRLQTSAGETSAGLQTVRAGILNLAGEVGVSAEDMSKAMYMIESASYHGTAGLGVLKAAMQGAKAEGADEAKVANALTSALRDYYPHASSAADVTQAAATVMSKFVGATSAGKMTFDDLAGSLHTLLPAAMAAGVSMNDALAALASMTVHGVSAEQATQNLAHALGHLQTLTAPQAREFALLGISANDLKEKLSSRGLTGTVELIGNAIKEHMGGESKRVILDLETALKGLPPAVQSLGRKMLDGAIDAGQFTKATKDLTVEQAGQAQQFATLAKSTHGLGKEQKDSQQIWQTYSEALKAAMGDQTGLNVALMIGGENMDYTKSALKTLTDAMPDAEGNVKGWAEVQGTFNQKMSEAKDGLGAMAIKIGTVLLPAASAIAGVFADVAGWFSKNEGAARALAIVIGTVVVAALGAGIVGLVRWLGSMSSMATAVAGTTLKLGLLATGLQIGLTHMDSFAGVATLVVTGIAGIGTAVDLLKGPIGGMGNMFTNAKSGIKNFATDMGAAEGVFGKIKTAGKGAMDFLTGPWGIALGIAVGAIALFAGGTKDSTHAVDELTKAIQDDNGALGTNTRAWLVNKLEKDGALAKAKGLGIAEKDLTDALLGQGPALDATRKKLEELVKAHTHQEAGTTGGRGAQVSYHNALDDTGKAAQSLLGNLNGLSSSLNDSKEAAARQSAALHVSAGELDGNAKAALGATGSGKDLAGTSKAVTDAMDAERNEAKLLGDQLDFLNGGNINATKQSIRFKDSIDSMVKSLKDNGKTTDENSDKGRKNVSAVLDAVTAAQDHAKAVANQTHSMEAGNKAYQDDIVALQGVLAKAGLTKGQIDDLAKSFMQFPPDIKRDVTVDTHQAWAALSSLKGLMSSLYSPMTGMVGLLGTLGQFSHATGGLIGHFASGGFTGARHFDGGGRVSGIGTESSDSNPAMLSDDEYVTRARAVHKFGVPFMDVVNQGDVNEAYRMLAGRPDVSRGDAGALMASVRRGGTGGAPTTVINKYEVHAGSVITEHDLAGIVQKVVLRYGQRNNGTGLNMGWNV